MYKYESERRDHALIPNYDHWVNKENCHIMEALLLIQGIEPSVIKIDVISNLCPNLDKKQRLLVRNFYFNNDYLKFEFEFSLENIRSLSCDENVANALVSIYQRNYNFLDRFYKNYFLFLRDWENNYFREIKNFNNLKKVKPQVIIQWAYDNKNIHFSLKEYFENINQLLRYSEHSNIYRNFVYLSKMDAWTEDEIISLLLDYPDINRRESHNKIYFDHKEEITLENAFSNAVWAKVLKCLNEDEDEDEDMIYMAKDIINWALNKKIKIHHQFLELINYPIEIKNNEETKLRNNQRHRERCRALALYLWNKDPNITVTQMANKNDIKKYGCEKKTYTPRVMQDWIRDISPNKKDQIN